MATLEEQFNWLKQILREKPDGFRDYFKDDIAHYLDIEEINAEDLQNLFRRKFELFVTCEDKEDVREFIERIVGYLIMHDANQDTIEYYLYGESIIPIKTRLY